MCAHVSRKGAAVPASGSRVRSPEDPEARRDEIEGEEDTSVAAMGAKAVVFEALFRGHDLPPGAQSSTSETASFAEGSETTEG